LLFHVGGAAHRYQTRSIGQIERIVLHMRLAARCVGECNALHD
jgi:hypothetical protein